MARNPAEIATEIQESITTSDPTIDVNSGPVVDLFISPQAGQLATASDEATALRQLFSLDFSSVATDEELSNALANFGSSPGVGQKSTVIQYFMRFAKPTQDVTIPAGTLVSTIDGSLIFRSLTETVMLAENAATYYNPSRRAYEIAVSVESAGVGTTYNVPKFRINTLLTSVQGVDAVENRVAATGGKDAESTDSQATRLKNALKGINLGSPGGIKSKITNSIPEIITDVSVVQPYQPEFTRLVVGPALDIYCIGTVFKTQTQTFTALASQTIFPLNTPPVLAINSVLINGVSNAVSFQLVADSSLENGYSLNSQDFCVISAPSLAGDQVTIEYTYNQALYDVRDLVFVEGESYLFNTDMLIRSPRTVYVQIEGRLRALSSYTQSEVENSLNTFLSNLLNFNNFTGALYPEVVRQRILTEVSGVQSFSLTTFKRYKGSLSDIEPVIFASNEVSKYNATYINIEVSS